MKGCSLIGLPHCNKNDRQRIFIDPLTRIVIHHCYSLPLIGATKLQRDEKK
jgi:hypothetical protein